MNRATSPILLPPLLLLLAAAPGAQDATSTFGHARARQLAELGRLPTARDVVVRDLVNYHRHRLPLPKAGMDVALDLRFDRAVADIGEDLWLQVGYTTAPLGDRALAPPCAVALVVDCSGSMAEAGKMAQVQAGLRAFVRRLRADDEVALVTFSTEAQLVLPRRRVQDAGWLLDPIAALTPGGNTNLHAGLMLGLRELDHRDGVARHRRVVLLTDGIANRGITESGRILDDVRPLADRAIDISTIGVGQNLDVSLLQRLADGARGLFHFVADATDVEKVFVQEADSLLSPVARGVHLSLHLPPGLRAVAVLHEGARIDGHSVELALPDLNAGVTGVVMVRCRIDQDDGDSSAVVRAELRATSADSGPMPTLCSEAALRCSRTTYEVQPGDTLARIARLQLGDARRSDEILAANPDCEPQRLQVGQRLRLPTAPMPDLEVRKNAAIAVLAQGLADMAATCDARRWADADRCLRLASDAAQRVFPGDDPDLQRVRDIVDGHQRTLGRYVDRFRDL